jgi:hypothetical protein
MSGENIHESAKARHHKELLVWQRSLALAKLAHRMAERFPVDEKFGLTATTRRSAVLIEIDELQRMLNAITRKLVSNSPLSTSHSPLPPDKKKDSV